MRLDTDKKPWYKQKTTWTAIADIYITIDGTVYLDDSIYND